MKKIIILFIVIIILIPYPVYAETEEEIMQSTQEKFNISEFIKESEKYKGEFLEDIDLNDILNDAIKGNINNKTFYKKVLQILGSEISSTIKVLISILVIIVIHSILKSITDNLENNNISQIIYFTEYILIVSLIMSNFTEIINQRMKYS